MCRSIGVHSYSWTVWSQEWPLPVREIRLCVCDHGTYADTLMDVAFNDKYCSALDIDRGSLVFYCWE